MFGVYRPKYEAQTLKVKQRPSRDFRKSDMSDLQNLLDARRVESAYCLSSYRQRNSKVVITVLFALPKPFKEGERKLSSRKL
jgi:hypothetical protein